MRLSLRLVVVAGAALLGSVASAQTYVREQRTYSTGDVMAILGKPSTPSPPTAIPIADISASVKTKVDCGKVDIIGNLNISEFMDEVEELPNRLAGQLRSLGAAIPMLALCYASPALCAEVKNMNFNINERLKVLTDVCKSVDEYIGERAAVGAKATGMAICINERIDAGEREAAATKHCKENPPSNTYVNIAQAKLRQVTTQAPQTIIRSLLEANGVNVASGVGQQNYRFLTAMLGELRMEVNGQLIPVFPAAPMSSKMLGDHLFTNAVNLACSEPRFNQAVAGTLAPEPAVPPAQDTQDLQRSLFEVVRKNVQPRQVQDLFVLDPPDRDLACNALGRAFAKTTMKGLTEEARALFTSALQNPALPESVRDLYQQRASAQFAAMLQSAEESSESSIPTLLKYISEMAAKIREERAIEALAATRALNDQDREFKQTECTSEETCR